MTKRRIMDCLYLSPWQGEVVANSSVNQVWWIVSQENVWLNLNSFARPDMIGKINHQNCLFNTELHGAKWRNRLFWVPKTLTLSKQVEVEKTYLMRMSCLNENKKANFSYQ